MILVDTSVWIDHLRSAESDLSMLLGAGNVLIHPMILGELACGNLPDRTQTLRSMMALPVIGELSHERVVSGIESRELSGRGIGFIDAHLICSVLECQGALLWTRDKRLKRVAEDLGVVFSERQ